ncbi:MAG: response regulator transcription factor [Bdellovibrionales bacterium]
MDYKPVILIVDDEAQIRGYLTEVLSCSFRVLQAGSAVEAYALLENESPDLILTDILMPGESGIAFCQELRTRLARPSVPIVMLSALDEPETRIKSFEAGADDYIAKPFRPDELCARLSARLRRMRAVASKAEITNKIEVGNLSLDLARFEAKIGNERLQIGPVEFRILSLLARHLGELRSRDEIGSFVWGDKKPASRALDPHINALRKKLAQSELELRTVYGAGYALRLKKTT